MGNRKDAYGILVRRRVDGRIILKWSSRIGMGRYGLE
jgi:hypothetical protein